MLRPVQAARSLSTRNLSGITLYAPQELIVSARAGTTMPDLEAALAEGGQGLIAEPPDLSGLLGEGQQTLGGMVATNLSGPRRIAWGAMRDHVMGVRAVNGAGELIRSGGRVLKNVTGLDLCKLLSGSHGTLAVLTEVTLKVLPVAEQTGSLVLPGWRGRSQGWRRCRRRLGSPFGVSGAAWLPADASARVPELAGSGRGRGGADRGFRAERRVPPGPAGGAAGAVRPGRLCSSTTGQPGSLAGGPRRRAAGGRWRGTRSGGCPCGPSRARGAGPRCEQTAGARCFLDWGGGLVWACRAARAARPVVTRRRQPAGAGIWTVLRGPEAMRAAVDVVPPGGRRRWQRITRRVKAAMDPHGILNPGRLYAGL